MMLTTVYHPIDPPRYMEDDEADKLKATGVWFDTPTAAKKYLDKLEAEMNQESMESSRPPVTKNKGKRNER